MTRFRAPLLAVVLTLGIALLRPGLASAQADGPRADPKLRLFAAATLDVAAIHEELDALLALPENKKVERQAQIRADAGERIAHAIEARGLTRAEYDRYAFLVASDRQWKAVFQRWVEQLRGAVRPTR